MNILSVFLGTIKWFIWVFFQAGISLLPALLGDIKWFIWAFFECVGSIFRRT